MATIKYKGQTLEVSAGETITLHTSNQKFTEDIIIDGSGTVRKCFRPHVYYANSVDELPADAVDGSLAVVTEEGDGWAVKSWTFESGNGFYGSYIWSDGTDIYWSDGSETQRLTKEGGWEPFQWNGLEYIDGNYVWTDGTNIYYSSNIGEHYVLYKETKTWEPKAWNIPPAVSFYGTSVWLHNGNVYFTGYKYGNPGFTCVLNGDTWEEKTLNGLSGYNSDDIWTDGVNTYCNLDTYVPGTGVVSNTYILNDDTWEEANINTPEEVSIGRYSVWTDGTNTYSTFSNWGNNNNEYHTFVLNGNTWEEKTWNGYQIQSGEMVWTDGKNVYYSEGTSQYVLSSNVPKNTLYSRQNGEWVEEGETNVSADSPLPIEVSTEEEMTAILTKATASSVGSVYKYTGETTKTYENGSLYIIAEEGT